SRWRARHTARSPPRHPALYRRCYSIRRRCRPRSLTALRRPGNDAGRTIGQMEGDILTIRRDIIDPDASRSRITFRPLRPLRSAQVPDLVPGTVLIQVKIAVGGVEVNIPRRSEGSIRRPRSEVEPHTASTSSARVLQEVDQVINLAVFPDDPTAPGRIAVDVIGHEFHPLKGKRLHLSEAAFFFFFSAGFTSSKPRIKSSRSLAGLSARRMTLPFLNFFMTSTLLSQLPYPSTPVSALAERTTPSALFFITNRSWYMRFWYRYPSPWVCCPGANR